MAADAAATDAADSISSTAALRSETFDQPGALGLTFTEATHHGDTFIHLSEIQPRSQVSTSQSAFYVVFTTRHSCALGTVTRRQQDTICPKA